MKPIERIKLAFRVLFNNRRYVADIEYVNKLNKEQGRREMDAELDAFITKLVNATHNRDEFVARKKEGHEYINILERGKMDIDVSSAGSLLKFTDYPIKQQAYAAQMMVHRHTYHSFHIDDRLCQMRNGVLLRNSSDFVGYVQSVKNDAVDCMVKELHRLVSVEVYTDERTGLPVIESSISVYKRK